MQNFTKKDLFPVLYFGEYFLTGSFCKSNFIARFESMHYLKINKGVWLQKGSEEIIQLSNDFYLNLEALTAFSFYRLEADLTVFNTNRVLKKWENYILELSLPGHEVFKFIIHVTDDLLLQKIESLLDAIDLVFVFSVHPEHINHCLANKLKPCF